MSVKILATGDIHIGKKSTALTTNAKEIATKHTWDQIINKVIHDDFDVLVLTGDIVDRDNRYFEAVGPLQTGFNKLCEAGIPVFLISGNHDYDVLRQTVDQTKYKNIHFLGVNGQWETKTITINGQEIRFVGWSFPSQHVATNPLLDLELNHQDIPTIGLLHTDLDSNHSHYAPVRTENFFAYPVDAWILGHIHKPQIVRENSPLISYPGSPHALSPKEQGIHGPLQITVESKHNIRFKQLPFSPVRYETLAINITGTQDEESLRKLVTDSIQEYKETNRDNLIQARYLILDLLLTGEHSNIGKIEEWMSAIKDYFNYEEDINISVRKIDYDIQPAIERLTDLAKEASPAGLLAETILAIQNERTTPLLNNLIRKWKEEAERINNAPVFSRLKTNHRIMELTEQTAKNEILTQCRRLLAELLTQKAEK